jgi:hypothetical protein
VRRGPANSRPPEKPPPAVEDAIDDLPDYTVFDDLRYAE